MAELKNFDSWQESMECFRIFFEHAPDAILIFDADSRGIIEANPAAERLFGCSRGELLRQGARFLYGDNQPEGGPLAESLQSPIQQAMAGKEVIFERTLRNVRGQDLLCQVRVVRLPVGEPRLVRLSFLDLTESQKTQQALEEQKERYRLITEHMQDAVWMMDRDFKITWISPSVTRIRGFTLEELQALPIEKRMTSDTLKRRADYLAAYFTEEVSGQNGTEKIIRDEFEYYKKDGTVFWADTIVSLLQSPDGSPAGFLCVGRDMTERKAAEAALRESEYRFRSLFENMLEGYAYCRMIYEEGRPVDFIYLEVNSAFEHLTGLKNVAGKRVTEVVPGIRESHPELFEVYGRVALTGLPEQLETYSEAFGGTLSVSVYSTESRHFVAVFDNITERKQDEKEREIATGFLNLINESTNRENLIHGSLLYLQKQSGCEAAGIRLKEGEDYPYYEVHGFPEAFVRLENSLCARDEKGEVIRDPEGHPIIECMCGNIVGGRFDSAKSFFTHNGSFWSSETTELLASTSNQDRMARTRNRCNGFGYESVALIPLRYREERLGLIQLNDHQKGMFTPRNMALYERLAGYLAVAIVRFQAEEEIRRLNQTLEQKVIKRTAQLEALNKELEGFSYSVSHDLQAPLRHMTGFVNLLHNQYRDKFDEKGLHYLQVLSESAQKMSRMINSLLAYTRLGRVELRRIPVETDKVLKEALQLVESDLENRKVEWSIQ
ncbi:MAG TPA: PAS domain S-box protein, partial [Thermodesulfobacteriota bacterium]|nr:PAS domain S-box protein [Thermodesulfobacteriota bacterium]